MENENDKKTRTRLLRELTKIAERGRESAFIQDLLSRMSNEQLEDMLEDYEN